MNLTILKLRSGEEITCQILEENNLNVKIFQPMIFKTISTVDNSGRPYDITSLQDWLSNSDEKSVEIPLNHIAFRSEPNQETISLYRSESYQFNKEEYKKMMQTQNDVIKDDLNSFTSFLEELINTSSNLYPPAPPKKKRVKKKQKDHLPLDIQDESELDRHMIMMQLYIPSEAIMNLLTSEIIKPDTLLDMVNEVKKRNRFSGDEKNRKDFGNKLSDWNPDPKSDDYK